MRPKDPSACGRGGGAWPPRRSLLIGWEEAWAGALSRGRRGVMSVHCCVIWVKVGGERKAERASGFSHVLRLWRANIFSLEKFAV